MTRPVFAGLCSAAGVIGLGRTRSPPAWTGSVRKIYTGRLSAVVYAAVQIGLIRRRTACAGVCGARRARLDVESQRRR